MRKKLIIFIFLLTTSLFMESIFCMSQKKVNEVQLNGYIRIYGSEPFTYVGFVTDDEKSYTIQADEKIISELRSLQGERIDFSGIIVSPQVFEVKQYKIVKSK